jgi:inhibitor of KinA
MNYAIPSYRIFPLGDQAVTVDFGQVINETINKQVLCLFYDLTKNPLPGTIEMVPAYSSLTIYYDLTLLYKILPTEKLVYDQLVHLLDKRIKLLTADMPLVADRTITIPVCYEKEFAPDIDQLASHTKCTVDEIITIHTASFYRVYMIGFLPGFAYMGEVNERIQMSRKPQPANVQPGSVGIAGSQTGIYPLASPGGWQIIGRTPVTIFDTTKEDLTYFKVGDIVQFKAISKHEFENY